MSSRNLEDVEALQQRILDLEQANQQLAAENRSLHQILETLPLFVCKINRELRVSYLNKIDPNCHQDAVGRPIRDFMTPDEAKLAEAKVSKTFDEQVTCSFTTVAVTTNRILKTLYIPLAGDSDGTEVVGMMLDVTEFQEELQKLESIAEASDARFRNLVDHAPVPVVISEKQTGRLLTGNQVLADTFEIPLETLTERTSISFYAASSERDAMIQQLRETGSVDGMLVPFTTGKGKRMWGSIYVREITFDERPALLGFILNVTEQREHEEAIQKDRSALHRLLEANEKDRALIAFDLHDGAIQDMTAAHMFVQTGLSSVPEESSGHALIAKGVNLISRAVDQSRRLLNGLRPLSLEEGGVVAAVRDLVSDFDDHGFQVDFTHDVSDVRLAPSLEMATFRTIQEALNNAYRHSKASEAKAQLTQDEEWVRICIQDYGVGFDLNSVPRNRYGLKGIQERAVLLGGDAKILTMPGKGTTIEVMLPCINYSEMDSF